MSSDLKKLASEFRALVAADPMAKSDAKAGAKLVATWLKASKALGDADRAIRELEKQGDSLSSIYTSFLTGKPTPKSSAVDELVRSSRVALGHLGKTREALRDALEVSKRFRDNDFPDPTV